MRQSMDSFFRSFLVIKKSRFPHGGLGVFVKPQCTIPANTCISWYSGILRSPNPTDVDNSYLFQNVADVFLTDPTSLHDSSFPTYLSRLNENIFHSLDAEGVASQDSDLPSVNNSRFSNSLLGHFTLGAVVTSRRIKAGEELTIFLGHDYGPAWSHYYSHLIQHTHECIQVLLREHHPLLATHYTAAFRKAHHQIFLDHVRSTIGSVTDAPSPSLTLLSFILCCFQSPSFRNATVFRRAYNPRFPQPTASYIRSLPDPWAEAFTGTSCVSSPPTTASLLHVLASGPSQSSQVTLLSSPVPQISQPLLTESASSLSNPSPIYRSQQDPLAPLTHSSSSPMIDSSSQSIASSPSLAPPINALRPLARIVAPPVNSPSLLSRFPYQFLLRATSFLPLNVINQYSIILNNTPGFCDSGSVIFPANAHILPLAPLASRPSLYLFLPILFLDQPWALLAVHIPSSTFYWMGPADSSPSICPDYSPFLALHAPRLGYGPIQPIAFPVSHADSGLLLFSIVYSLFSSHTPSAPSNYAVSRRRFLGALLRPHIYAKNIWLSHSTSGLSCPLAGSHRFGTTCPSCLWSKSRPSLTPRLKEPELLPRLGIRDLSFDDFPIEIHLASTLPAMTIATYNINGLTEHKIPAISHLFASLKLDILLLVDSRLSPKTHKRIAGLFRDCLHPQLFIASALGFPASSSSPAIGGLTALVHPKWSGHIQPFSTDSRSPHTLARLKFHTTRHHLQFICTYIPVAPSSTSAGHLWNRCLPSLPDSDPLQHTLLQSTLWAASHPGPTFLLGDLNGAWPSGGGSHNLTPFLEQGWASPAHLCHTWIRYMDAPYRPGVVL